MRDPIPERRALKRARMFRHAAIIWILFFFDVLSLATGKEPIAAGVFSSALFLYVAWLIL